MMLTEPPFSADMPGHNLMSTMVLMLLYTRVERPGEHEQVYI